MASSLVRTTLRPSVLTTAGLVGGFAAARATHRRELGGVLFALAGAAAARQWGRSLGPLPAAGLTVLYAAAMGGSHPLARKLGPWGAVAAVTAVVVAASEAAGGAAHRR